MTTKAISQFEMTRAHFEEDGYNGYDMLIDNYDFDSLPVFRNGTPNLAILGDDFQKFCNLRLLIGMQKH